MTKTDPLVFENVSKNYGAHCAVSGVSFEVKSGQMLCLLGPNGAGKSSCMKMITGLEPVSSGQVLLFGQNPTFKLARQKLGSTPQDVDFPKTLKVREVLSFTARHYPKPIPLAECLERFGLSDFKDQLCFSLSGGQKRRLALACALVGRPQLVLLDEPTTGLDIEVRELFWSSIRAYVHQGGSVLLTTHYLEEAQALAQHIVLLNRGQVCFNDSAQALKNRFSKKRVIFDFTQAHEVIQKLLADFSAEPVEISDSRACVLTNSSDALVQGLVKNNIHFHNLTVEDLALEEALKVFKS